MLVVHVNNIIIGKRSSKLMLCMRVMGKIIQCMKAEKKDIY